MSFSGQIFTFHTPMFDGHFYSSSSNVPPPKVMLPLRLVPIVFQKYCKVVKMLLSGL